MRAIVITISDSAFAGTSADLSGPAVQEKLTELGWTCRVEILPDEHFDIAQVLSQLCDRHEADVIFTVGGTGVAPRDVTPEATRDIVDRELPGIAEYMRMRGLESTPKAILSRSVAGTRKKTLIVNLPGSPKAAVESLNAIVNVVPHVVDLLHGRTEHGSRPKLGPAQ